MLADVADGVTASSRSRSPIPTTTTARVSPIRFPTAFKERGGTVTIVAAHEDGKGDYSAEVGALAAAGGDALAVLGYVDQGGRGIMQSAIDTGAFDTFALGDGMIGDSLLDLPGLDFGQR